jgi:hypothetical protein
MNAARRLRALVGLGVGLVLDRAVERFNEPPMYKSAPPKRAMDRAHDATWNDARARLAYGPSNQAFDALMRTAMEHRCHGNEALAKLHEELADKLDEAVAEQLHVIAKPSASTVRPPKLEAAE